MMNKDDKMVFFYRQGHETITVSISAQSSLTEAVEAFERFLKGAGYHFDERLDFVADEETLGSADEDEETPIVFGSNDWENSINLDLQNMGAAGPTLTASMLVAPRVRATLPALAADLASKPTSMRRVTLNRGPAACPAPTTANGKHPTKRGS